MGREQPLNQLARTLVLGAVCLGAIGTSAVPLSAQERSSPELTFAVGTFRYHSALRSTDAHYALEGAWHQPLSRAPWAWPYHLSLGLRTALPLTYETLPLELFSGGRLRAAFGVWEPAVGVELGWSGFTVLSDIGWGALQQKDQQRISGFYTAFQASILRFHPYSVHFSVLELQAGTTLNPPGAATRFQLLFLRLGGDL